MCTLAVHVRVPFNIKHCTCYKKIVVNGTSDHDITPHPSNLYHSKHNCSHNVSANDSKLDICRLHFFLHFILTDSDVYSAFFLN